MMRVCVCVPFVRARASLACASCEPVAHGAHVRVHACAGVRARARARTAWWGGPQVLIPTYLTAPPEEYTPYMAKALEPCLPICLLGVTAHTWQGEYKSHTHALSQWWKDPCM